MPAFLAKLKQIGASHLGAVILVLLGVVEIANLAVVVGEQSNNVLFQKPILKISEIRGPRIDDEAAMIVAEKALSVCRTLPLNLWVFLVVAYVALLVFNFSYTFKDVERPQWFWETLYALAFIAGWFVWDSCHKNIWFPFAIVKFGLIIFALYAYFLKKKQAAAAQTVGN
jgi:hypothetical protein